MAPGAFLALAKGPATTDWRALTPALFTAVDECDTEEVMNVSSYSKRVFPPHGIQIRKPLSCLLVSIERFCSSEPREPLAFSCLDFYSPPPLSRPKSLTLHAPDKP